MAQQGNAGRVTGRNYAARLDQFPELWTEILKHVPEADRLRHMPMVSQVLSRACRDPSLWPAELRVSPGVFSTKARWQSLLRWLAVRAPVLQTLVFGRNQVGRVNAAAWEARSPELVRVLAASAPQLRSLECWYPDWADSFSVTALVIELGLLSQLTSLTLDLGRAVVTGDHMRRFTERLPGLQHLKLSFSRMGQDNVLPYETVTSCRQLQSLVVLGVRLMDVRLWDESLELGQLTGLTRLALSCAKGASLPDSISRLSALERLEISDPEPETLPLGMHHLTALTRLELSAAIVTSLPDSISQLTALKYLQISAEEPGFLPLGFWHELWQLTALTQLDLKDTKVEYVPWHLTALRCLEMSVEELAEWLPGEWCLTPTGLTRLVLADVAADAYLPNSISQLSALRELDLGSWECPKLSPGLTECQQLTRLAMGVDSSSPVLASLRSLRSLVVWAAADQEKTYWTQLTALTQLQLYCHGEQNIHPGLADMARLIELTINNTGSHALERLPQGPYLSSLEILRLSSCTAVPASLAAATQLRHLDLRSVHPYIELTASDLATLGTMQALESLYLEKPRSLNQALWDARMAQLRAKFLAACHGMPTGLI